MVTRIWFPETPTGTVDSAQRKQIGVGASVHLSVTRARYPFEYFRRSGVLHRIWFPEAPSGSVTANQRKQIGVGTQ